MTAAVSDLLTAICTTWDQSGLDDQFKALWKPEYTADDYMVLHDTEAEGHQPFPYCVFQTEKPKTVTRMTGASGTKREIRDELVHFTVHAEKCDSILEHFDSRLKGTLPGNVVVTRSAKEVAAYLIDEVMKVFGGHPTVVPQAITMDNGGHLLTQYQTDYPEKTELYKWSWTVTYLFRIDEPVAVGVV